MVQPLSLPDLGSRTQPPRPAHWWNPGAQHTPGLHEHPRPGRLRPCALLLLRVHQPVQTVVCKAMALPRSPHQGAGFPSNRVTAALPKHVQIHAHTHAHTCTHTPWFTCVVKRAKDPGPAPWLRRDVRGPRGGMHGAQAMPSQPQAEGRCFRDEDLPACNVAPKLQASLTFLSSSVSLGTISVVPNLPGNCKLPCPLVKRCDLEGGGRRSSPGCPVPHPTVNKASGNLPCSPRVGCPFGGLGVPKG